MAGLKGNVAWWAVGKQADKTTAATTCVVKAPFVGGSISVTRETANLAETDSSRDQGISYVTRTGVEGGPEAYVRDASIHTILEGVLGTKTDSGTGSNYSHAITPANDLPYYTFWRNQSDVLYEQFTGCKFSEVTIKGEAGAPLTVTTAIMGLTPTRSDTEFATSAAVTSVESGPVYSYNETTVSFGGTVTSGLITGSPTVVHNVRSVEVQISNNVSMQQTDNVVPYDLAAAQRTVNVSFDLILETLDEYNKFFYGGVSGTTAGSSIYTTPMQIKFSKTANNSLTFDIPSVAYEAFPVQPNPNGDPIVVSVRAQAQRTGSAANPIITATVKNQKAT
ncbi:hypothetical protein UFOVP1328_39 [uncultured Caudovirales phage]|uniref:Major tail protein n=1 Tax=uncultured Caudovirales phage TaxID=2100421 RepID=A0A6J7XEI9_9CAUD|nr:hypothetical protein UFOVP1084_39 [uncultured Caudovirales phage]CAB4199390.1 hypothetical protein UFOVP1328_39 [uncultured Caudovirales phage]CAB5228265.1 hypothetical protein UFOVP1532_7 [uncultured Caudovirales phage]